MLPMRLGLPKLPKIPKGIGQFNPFMPRPFEGGFQGGQFKGGFAGQPGMPMFPGQGNQLGPNSLPMPFGGGLGGMPMHPPMPLGMPQQPMQKPDDIRRGQPGIGMNPFQPLMNFGRQVQRY